MTSLVLAASNHASFNSSIWSAWAGAPHDLLLVTEDGGMLEAHCGILLPLSHHLAAIVEALPDSELTQVLLAGTSIKAVTAVRDLVYTGACLLDELILPEILETLCVFGIEVSSGSLSFAIESEDDEKTVATRPPSNKQDFESVEEVAVAHGEGNDVVESIEERHEGADVGVAIKTKVKIEDKSVILKDKIVGKMFRDVDSSLNTGHEGNEQDLVIGNLKSSDVQAGPLKSRTIDKHSVHPREKPNDCNQCFKKFSSKNSLRWHEEGDEDEADWVDFEEGDASVEEPRVGMTFKTQEIAEGWGRKYCFGKDVACCTPQKGPKTLWVACVHGGKRKSRSEGKRKRKTIKMNCPMALKFYTLQSSGRTTLRSFKLDHNHVVSGPMFKADTQSAKC